MTQQSVYVQQGTVTTVHPQLAAGATIYNGDINNAVWVASSPSVSPNAGMRIGPKGSLQWTNNNAPCYAATDGVSVTLTVSTDIQNLNNPVDIGVAVATQLLANGIPSVFLGNVISSGNSLPVLGGGYGITNLDVSRYASVVVTIRPTLSSQISATCTDDFGGNLGSFDFPVTYAGSPVTFSIPVTGPILSLTSTSATYSYNVYGSNRSVPGPRIMNGYSQTVQQNFTQAFTLGTPAYLTQPFTSNGKPVFLRMVVTGTGVGKFGYRGFDSAGAIQFFDLIDSATGIAGTDGKEIECFVNLPPGKLQLYFYPTVTATYTVVVTLGQEHY